MLGGRVLNCVPLPSPWPSWGLGLHSSLFGLAMSVRTAQFSLWGDPPFHSYCIQWDPSLIFQVAYSSWITRPPHLLSSAVSKSQKWLHHPARGTSQELRHQPQFLSYWPTSFFRSASRFLFSFFMCLCMCVYVYTSWGFSLHVCEYRHVWVRVYINAHVYAGLRLMPGIILYVLPQQ